MKTCPAAMQSEYTHNRGRENSWENINFLHLGIQVEQVTLCRRPSPLPTAVRVAVSAQLCTSEGTCKAKMAPVALGLMLTRPVVEADLMVWLPPQETKNPHFGRAGGTKDV